MDTSVKFVCVRLVLTSKANKAPTERHNDFFGYFFLSDSKRNLLVLKRIQVEGNKKSIHPIEQVE